ncbi:MAG: LysR family transcriptional regulator [Deltaproteobacteria bacterium]
MRCSNALPPLKRIVAFEVVARLDSVNKAADELNVTASAVSHQIANLEGFVGRRLFERTSRELKLTSVGERYRRDVTGALALLASAAHNARSSEGVQVLRVHCARLGEPLADAAAARISRRAPRPTYSALRSL